MAISWAIRAIRISTLLPPTYPLNVSRMAASLTTNCAYAACIAWLQFGQTSPWNAQLPQQLSIAAAVAAVAAACVAVASMLWLQLCKLWQREVHVASCKRQATSRQQHRAKQCGFWRLTSAFTSFQQPQPQPPPQQKPLDLPNT